MSARQGALGKRELAVLSDCYRTPMHHLGLLLVAASLTERRENRRAGGRRLPPWSAPARDAQAATSVSCCAFPPAWATGAKRDVCWRGAHRAGRANFAGERLNFWCAAPGLRCSACGPTLIESDLRGQIGGAVALQGGLRRAECGEPAVS